MTLNTYDRANSHVSASAENAERIAAQYATASRTGDLGSAHTFIVRARVHARRISKRAAWVCACIWDGIDADSPFVVWTETNPYAARYDALIAL